MLVAEGGRVLEAVSLALGVVQLVERFFVHDPVTTHELDACRAYVDARLRDEAWDRVRPHRPATLVATAGTPTTLAVLDLGLPGYDPGRVQGHRLGATAIARLTVRLAALPLAERARTPGLEPGGPTSSCRARSCSPRPSPASISPPRRSRTRGSARASSSMRSGGVRRLRRHASEAGAPAPPSEQRRVPILAASCALC